VRAAISGIDRELEKVSEELAGYEELLERRRRLLAARSALTGTGAHSGSERRRFSQDEIAAYLADHPESWPAEIAAALGAPVTNVSAHLSRGRDTRFARGERGWRLRAQEDPG
jgi:hypothetical protein